MFKLALHMMKLLIVIDGFLNKSMRVYIIDNVKVVKVDIVIEVEGAGNFSM